MSDKPTPSPARTRCLIWFSRGAASAVAAKVALARYAATHDVEVCYCDTSADEHPDGERFEADVARWLGVPVKRLRHPKYRGVEDVWLGTRYIVGPAGASCTRVLKREVREAYQRPDDLHVFGFTADEARRIADIERHHPDMRFAWVLVPAGITKQDCYNVLRTNGIALPAIYGMGYDNANCLGCCKGGMGYWNKIRRDFPDVFARRARVQRVLGVGFGSGDPDRMFFLDTLDPDAGRPGDGPGECGLFCSHYATLVDLAVAAAPAPASEGGKS